MNVRSQSICADFAFFDHPVLFLLFPVLLVVFSLQVGILEAILGAEMTATGRTSVHEVSNYL